MFGRQSACQVRHLGTPVTRSQVVTEGVRKVDAIVSKGMTAIALLGVWNWRGTNQQGGKTALADWEAVALNGRPVYLCFDSDVMTKPRGTSRARTAGALPGIPRGDGARLPASGEREREGRRRRLSGRRG